MVYNTAVMCKDQFSAQRTRFYAIFVLLVSIGFAFSYLYVGIARVTYPYALDFVEEDMLMQAWRVAQHLPVFVPPNADFVPQVYMPLYTWLGGQVLRFVSPAFWPLRLLSFLSTLTTAVLVAGISWQESGRWQTAVTGASVFLAGYRITGGWYDLARVDALFVALSMAGLWATARCHQQKQPQAILAGFLLGLAILTKQNGLVLALVAGIYFWLAIKPLTKWYILGLLGITIIPLVWLEWTTEGWFSYYVIDIAYASPVSPLRIWHTVSRELAGGMGVLVLFLGITAVWQWRAHAWRVRQWLSASPWVLFIPAAVFISVAGRSSEGGNFNNLIPAWAFLSLTPALADSLFFGRRWVWETAVLLQLALTIVNPIPHKPPRYLPTPEMRAAGAQFTELITAVEGPVLIMMHPSYALRAGKEPGVHIQSLWHARQRGQQPLPPDFVERLRSGYYVWIISDESDFFEKDPALLTLLEVYYQPSRRLADNESPPTLSGPIVRPLQLYVPAIQAASSMSP